MDCWARKFLANLDKNKVMIYMFKKYVDDVNMAMAIMAPGLSWEREPDGDMRLVWTDEKEARDHSSQQGENNDTHPGDSHFHSSSDLLHNRPPVQVLKWKSPNARPAGLD